MIKRLTPMQWKTLAMLHKGRGEPKGCRAETIGALVDAGYIRVHATETEEQFRPSRSWSPVRWTRRRTEVHVIGLTPAGIEALAAHEAKYHPPLAPMPHVCPGGRRLCTAQKPCQFCLQTANGKAGGVKKSASRGLSATELKLLAAAQNNAYGRWSITTEVKGGRRTYTAGGRELAAAEKLVDKGLFRLVSSETVRDKINGVWRSFSERSYELLSR